MRWNPLTVGIGLGPLRRVTLVVLVFLAGLIIVPAALAATPQAFHKTSPANGATHRPTALSLKWGVSARATGYRYCIDRSNNSRCDKSWVSSHDTRSVRLSGLKRGATYYWQVKAVGAHGSTTADHGKWFSFKVSATAPKLPTPRAGHWTIKLPATGGGGAPGSIEITGAGFVVSSDHTAVVSFGFTYDYDGPANPPGGSCSGVGSSYESARSPISNDQFSTPGQTGAWTGAGSATFSGTFKTASSAHGTATFSVFISNPSCEFSGMVNTGTASWTASAG